MAKQVKLKAEKRAEIGRAAARKLKARGIVPAIIYGGKEKPPPLQLSVADVPLEPLGGANGVKNFGGLLEQNLRVLSIECLPRDLPDRITVDISALNIGDSIHVRDIKLPAGVTVKVQ